MKILLSGATGAMGRVVSREVEKSQDEIVLGYSDEIVSDLGYPVVNSLADVQVEVDVILDFSNHSVAPSLADFAVKHGLPLVVATTGHTKEEMDSIEKASTSVPVFYSGNMSLGVYAARKVTEMLSKLLDDFDVEVIEAHHHHKIDAPSGTAKMLVKAAKAHRPDLVEVYGRSGHIGARKTNEIGVHAVRGGSIVGEHQVIFAGADELVEIKHTALSKVIFAKGALKACHFLTQAKQGMYDMDNLMS